MAKMPTIPKVHNPTTVRGQIVMPPTLLGATAKATDKTPNQIWFARVREDVRQNRAPIAFAASFLLGCVIGMGVNPGIERDRSATIQEGTTEDYYQYPRPLTAPKYLRGKGGVVSEDKSYILNQLAIDDGFDGVTMKRSSEEASKEDGRDEVLIYLGKCTIPNVTIYYTTDTTGGMPTDINSYDFPEASLDRKATTVNVERSS